MQKKHRLDSSETQTEQSRAQDQKVAKRLDEIQNQNFIDKICYYARKGEKGEKKLRGLLAELKVTINVTQNELTPIMILAEEGNVEAVNFLIEKFNADPKKAINGYARGKNVKQVQAMLAKYSNPDNCFEMKLYAARGYGQKGHVEEARQMIDQEIDPENKHMLLRWTLYGLGMTGNMPQIRNLIATERDPAKKYVLTVWAVIGLGEGGHAREIKELIDEADTPFVKACFKTCGLHTLTRTGNVEKAKLLGIDTELPNLDLIIGLAQGGFTEKVMKLIKKETNPEYQRFFLRGAMMHLARSGYLGEMDKLIEEAKKLGESIENIEKSVVEGLARGGQFDALDNFLLKATTKRDELLLIAIINAARYGALAYVRKLLPAKTDDVGKINQFFYAAIEGLTSRGVHFMPIIIDWIKNETNPERQRNLQKAAINGLISANNFHALNEIFAAEPDADARQALKQHAMVKLTQGNRLDPKENAIQLLYLCKPLQEMIANTFPKAERAALLKQARKELRVVSKLQLQSCQQAQIYLGLDQDRRRFLLMQQSFLVSKQIPADVFTHISSLVIGASKQDTEQLIKGCRAWFDRKKSSNDNNNNNNNNNNSKNDAGQKPVIKKHRTG